MPNPEHRVIPTLDVLILARDEADVLPFSLSSVVPQLGPADRLTVVADHCEDSTAEVASSMGARVLLRHQGPVGKGQALKWWLNQSRAESKGSDFVIVLDADSWARPGFLSTMRRLLEAGYPVLQAMLEQVNHGAASPGGLASLSEFMDQRVLDGLASWLGWSVRLRGTGMGFRRDALERVAPQLGTAVEDAELTVHLSALDYPIILAQEAIVMDTKPTSDLAAVRQRARWLKGQLHLVQRHPGPLLSLLLSGPKGWYLLSSVLLKPRSLTLLLRAAALSVLVLSNSVLGVVGEWLQLMIVISLVADGAAMLAAVHLASDSTAAIRTLASLPAFVFIWLRSLLLAFRSQEGWLRARSPAHESIVTSPGPASP